MPVNSIVSFSSLSAMMFMLSAYDDAVPGENLPPMHTNCDCEFSILDGSGNVNTILTNRDPDETGEEDSAFLDKLQTVFDIAGLFPVFGEVFDGVNALIYLTRGDYLNAALSGAAIIPLIGSAATAGKLAAKTVKAVDTVNDARKVVKEAAQGVGKYTDDVAQGAGKAADDVAQSAGKSVLNAGNKADALKSIDNLPSNIQSKAKDFFKGGSNSYTDFSVEQMGNGNYMAKMMKPGNVPGSKAIYYKEIDPRGNTIRVFKETFDPAGNLVHIKEK